MINPKSYPKLCSSPLSSTVRFSAFQLQRSVLVQSQCCFQTQQAAPISKNLLRTESRKAVLKVN